MSISKPSLLTLFALLVVLLSACSSGGAYFLDDGLRLAHDAKTGKYMGTAIGECKTKDAVTAKDVPCYKVKRPDGSIVEVPAQNIRLSKP